MSEITIDELSGGVAQDLEDLLDSFQDIPTIPEVLVRIWQLLDDPKTCASDLERVVMLEPPLAAKVLRLANSPYYGGRGRIADIQTAITSLGFDVLRSLAVCLSVAESIGNVDCRDRMMNRKALWHHSMTTAVLSRSLAKELGGVDPEQAFTAGLLHDIGKLVISLGRPRAYEEVLRKAHQEEQSPLICEALVLGYDHAELGAAFAGRWNFPVNLQLLIASHHECLPRIEVTGGCTVALANRLSRRWSTDEVVSGLESSESTEELLERMGIEESWIQQRQLSWDEEIRSAGEFMRLV